ncbi:MULTISPECIES: TonB-dependent receptor [unclassified Leeuwenhoekiella]|uniref:TonB-dependent receptor n=1 Tax=unclassified Leeuwenhoekiella TaxID=2615029 RepID=UPI000C64D920|nr:MULTISPECIES: TonB-dependent receptor [unclassified Leeuwenhoekiella]MBA81124.1 hypothetical protein [Leeuwenhoekiella sp.]
MKLLITLLFFLNIQAICSAQNTQLSGTVKDTVARPLPNANILAFPQETGYQTRFAISSAEGLYRLRLESGIAYRVEVSYMGYEKITDTLRLTQDAEHDFIMKPLSDQLGEIVIKQRLAVKVREDTITYRTDNFVTGEERKLRDILKKLPGVEIDRDGNATVNGKEVTKLMVEGKDFFTGDEKLGVNNIPADAVDEVEAIDNYNEVAFLKGLSDSDKMVLNIKLKEGKKKFAFGDVEVGGGVEDRYLIHPNLFYYSSKTAVNLIGDFNNIGEKSFSLSDYINFEGGFSLLSKDPSAYFNLRNDDFAQFLNNDDFVFNKNEFGAFSISQELNKSTDLDAYSIVSNGKLETRNESDFIYLTDDERQENRTVTTNSNLLFTLNKIRLRYIPDSDVDLYAATYLKTSKGDGMNRLVSQTPGQNTFADTRTQPQSLDFKTDLSYNRQFSYKHTSTVEAAFQYSINENDRDWLFNRPVFSGIIPFNREDDTYNLLQNTRAAQYDFNINAKHYWVLHRFHHIYPEAGVEVSHQSYFSNDAQVLNDQRETNFTAAGFNNEVLFKLSDSYFGFQYKAKADDFIFKPGLFYHYYYWTVDQFEERQVGATKPVLLPELLVEWEINSGEKLKLNYSRRSQFGNASQLANRFRLSSFNSLFAGNQNLENQLSHSASLFYSKFSLYRGIFMNAGLSYRHQENSIRNTTQIEGIDQINTLIYTDLPENSYSANGSFTKKLGDYRLTLGGNLNLSDYSRIINSELLDYNSLNYGYNFKVETSFDNWPNLEAGLRHSFSDFSSSAFENTFQRISPFAYLDYDFLTDFILKANYEFTYYENKGQNQINRFQEASASLFYQKEGSAWGFELEAQNIFDIPFKAGNSFSQFLITDQRTFIQPRTLLFKVTYKL